MSIRVSHLTYTYRSRTQPALDDISAEFLPGHVTLIAGASGSGKTTLIRCINGLIPRSYFGGTLSGQVVLFGADTASMSLAHISLLVGTVLQDPEQQIIAAKVENEIAFGLENLGLPRAEIKVRIAQAAEQLHITHLLHHETFALSGGEKQKIALAGVLAMRPQAILLDEPLAMLDPEAGYETLQVLRELAASGIAIIIIEHRVEEVLAIQPEHCLYLSQGRVTYTGNASGLLAAVSWREMKIPTPAIIKQINDERRIEKRYQPGPRLYDETSSMSAQPAVPPRVISLPVKKTQEQPLVEFRHVHFSYGSSVDVLHDVSFTIHAGERVAVLGPNAAGKTTLVKHAIGLNKPTRGKVLVQGQDTCEISVAQVAHTVGFVFQSPSYMLFANTVREELSFGPRNLGLDEPAITGRVTHALAVVNLPGFEEYPPLALSFGQQKRISIASILSMDPRVLIMDEPSAGQDYASYTHFMDDIVGGSTHPFDAVLFITHDLDLAITYANRVLLVADGQKVADGPPEEVLQNRTLLQQCRLRPTSLLDENIKLLPQTGRFLPVLALANYLST